jgi:UDP-N-acetylmuramoyl-L-alanyl-D-glutamate--2,6-diaminopimelate ligase
VSVAGAQSDGAEFVADAVRRGAVAVLAERELDPLPPVPLALAQDALVALAQVAQRLYDDPTRGMQCVGVTGTNGKTTCTYLIEAMLKAAGANPAVLGTVNFRGPFGVLSATHTTPMADDMMRLARGALESGASHLVLEVSSHALAMYRADGVHFEVAAFTNLTQDHLDYHGDFASYQAAKRRLFTDLAPRSAVVNVDDAFGARLAAAFGGKLLRCSRKDQNAELLVLSNSSDRSGTRAQVRTPIGTLALESPLIGEHNLENLLIALGCGIALGLDSSFMLRGLRECHGAPGRLERIEHPRDVLVFVDYAHTPDALERVLKTVRANTPGRLFVVFGAGGDRDPGKRPLMGKAAAELADLSILTSDNPRSENPLKILQQIEAGVTPTGLPKLTAAELGIGTRGYVVEADRRAAIGLALAAATAGDSVLLAGKGHEKVQIVGDAKLPFDDCVEARAAITTHWGGS